jgi:TetR/AcrR family transcriptional regulator, cholesterol catabolism regulator
MDKERILNAAAQIIRQKGFHATSMQDIADAVDLQKASLYHHFSGKQEILLMLLDQAVDFLNSRVEVVIDQPLPADEKLRAAIHALLDALAERRDLISVLLLEYRSLDEHSRARHIPRRDRNENQWRRIVQEGVDSGIFRELDAGLTARLMLSALNWTVTWYKPSGPLTMDQIADQTAGIFINGLLRRN